MTHVPVRRRNWAPVMAGLACTAGFCVLAALWFTRGIWSDDATERLPGLFDYPSAYLGDSVLLPVAVALLGGGARALPAAARERSIAATAGAGGAIALTCLQMLWLLDDDPGRNWTLPSPHRFNIAGIWHAVYAVAVAALLAGAAALLARRMSCALRAGGAQRETAQRLLSGAGATAVLCCLFCYAVLAARDSSAATFGSRSTLAGLGLAFAAVLVLAALVLRRSFRHVWPAALLGLLAAAAAIAFFRVSWRAERTEILGAAQAVLTASGVALVTLVPRRAAPQADADAEALAYRGYRPGLGNAALAGLILAVLLPVLWTLAAAETAASHWPAAAGWTAGYAVAIAAAAGAVVRGNRLEWLRQAADVLAVFALLGVIVLGAVTAPRWHQASDSAPLISFVIAIGISRVFFPVLGSRLHAEIRDEMEGADAEGRFQLRGAARLSATATLGMLIVAGLTAAIALLSFTLAAAIDRKYADDAGALPGVWWLLAAGLGLVAGLAALAWVKTRAGAPALAFAVPAAVLAWPAVVVVRGVHGVPPETWAAVAGGVLLALWSANSLLNNAGLLRRSPIDALFWAVIGSVAVSAFVSGSFALSAALASDPAHVYTWFAGISTATAVLAVHGGLTAAAGSLVSRGPHEQTRHGLMHNLVQDSTVMVLLYLIALVIPVVTVLHLPASMNYWERLVATFAIVGPFLTYFLGPYQWQLTTNLEHLGREIDSRLEPDEREGARRLIDAESGPLARNRALLAAAGGRMAGGEQQSFLRVLSAHIRNQNLVANAVVVLGLIGILILVGGKTSAAFAYLRREMRLDPRPQP
ncbi:hypothetical protein ACGFJT_10590 [Actinomadura geliboluensis]|uniref:hypothetical protein n=1 Tax=Actinomadura geliboluensis TaxID=882440 RepID=UPI003716106C